MATTSTQQTLTVKGESGKSYTFYVHLWPTQFTSVGGVYLFTKKYTDQNRHAPLYLGITGDLSERFDNHHKMACIKKNGVTHICVLGMAGEADREAAEKDILATIKTTCNEMMN